MDTNTKAMFILTKEPAYVLLMKIMSDIVMEKANNETILAAQKIGHLFPELVTENTWLAQIAGMVKDGFETFKEEEKKLLFDMELEFTEPLDSIPNPYDFSGLELREGK